jgi:hypothetical protein
VRCGLAPQPVPGIPGYPVWRVSDIARFVDGGVRSFRSVAQKSVAVRLVHAESVRSLERER